MSKDKGEELRKPSKSLVDIRSLPGVGIPDSLQLANAAKSVGRRQQREVSGMEHPSERPSCILSDWLYLGSRQHAFDWPICEALGITHVLNITDAIPNYHLQHGVTYANIRVLDVDSVKLYEYFEAAAEFIDECNPHIAKRHSTEKPIATTVSTAVDSTPTTGFEPQPSVASETERVSDALIGGEHCIDSGTVIEIETKIRAEKRTIEDGKLEEESGLENAMKKSAESSRETVAQKRGAILVHCAMGVSRSAAVVVAYLMSRISMDCDTVAASDLALITEARNDTRQLYARISEFDDNSMPHIAECSSCGLISLHDAYYLVHNRRPIICPNRAFCHQLAAFERFLHRHCTGFKETASELPMHRGFKLNAFRERQRQAEATAESSTCCSCIVL